MTFKEFISKYKNDEKIRTNKDLYDFFGGKKLKVSYDYFLLMMNGKRPPSITLVEKIYEKVDSSRKKMLLSSFFSSVSDENSTIANDLTKYLQFPAELKRSLWDKKDKPIIYSDAQMEYLLSQPKSILLYFKILLLEKVIIDSDFLYVKEIKELQEQNLITIKKNVIRPSGLKYRIASLENSTNEKSISLGIKYLVTIFDLLLDKKGSFDQQIGLGLQFVTKQNAAAIFTELEAFKKSVFSLAEEPENLEAKIPIMFMTYVKKLKMEDLA